MAAFLNGDGRQLVCTPCVQDRELDEDRLIDESQLIAGARVIREVTTAKTTHRY